MLDPRLGQSSLPQEVVNEVPFVAVLHEHVDLVLQLEDVKEGDDVGMTDPSDDADLPREELAHEVRGGFLLHDHLAGHFGVAQLQGLVGEPHLSGDDETSSASCSSNTIATGGGGERSI